MRLPTAMISTMSPVCRVSAVHSSALELVLKHWMETSGVLLGELRGGEEIEENEAFDGLETSIIISLLFLPLSRA